MGQAKLRGSLTERVEQAKARLEAIKPEVIVCNHCKGDIKKADIVTLDSRGMDGIKGVFAGKCICGHDTLAVIGEPDAAAAVMALYQEAMGEDGILGAQPLLKM